MKNLGIDVGSSSIKVCLYDLEKNNVIASAQSPDHELDMISIHPGWAEQHPDTWWEHIKLALAKIKNKHAAELLEVEAIGISYQMHGLVVVDKNFKPLRPSIIWCDSRAVAIGEAAFSVLGAEFCLRHYLNSPGNFTASKLKWVKDNEPELYDKIHLAMLPGDYIALRITGEPVSTYSGMSEGILWDFTETGLNKTLLKHYGISPELFPNLQASFSDQGKVKPEIAAELGISPQARITYRAGDQPNNAFSLNVLNPGEVAANAGTSGVIYGIDDKPSYDPQSRVNTFVHVNHHANQPRYGVLACVNGTGILNSWTRKLLGFQSEKGLSYQTMNEAAAKAPAGSLGLLMYPYGNGAERTLGNKNPGAAIKHLDFNNHQSSHVLRATQEGIVYALNLGFDVMKGMGLQVNKVRAGHANMFLSPLFRQVFADVTQTSVELYHADGAVGAAIGAGVGTGKVKTIDAFSGIKPMTIIEPNLAQSTQYQEFYEAWKAGLDT